jgi:transposase InsO family protein
MKRELLDARRWSTKEEPAAAIFEWIEAWCNSRRRHTSLADVQPRRLGSLHIQAAPAA